jgi:hypothetical protein
VGRRGAFPRSNDFYLPSLRLEGGGVGSATCGREAKREAEEVAVIAVLAEVEMGEGVESVTKIHIFFLFLFHGPLPVVSGLHPVHRHVSNPSFCISTVFPCELMSKGGNRTKIRLIENNAKCRYLKK